MFSIVWIETPCSLLPFPFRLPKRYQLCHIRIHNAAFRRYVLRNHRNKNMLLRIDMPQTMYDSKMGRSFLRRLVYRLAPHVILQPPYPSTVPSIAHVYYHHQVRIHIRGEDVVARAFLRCLLLRHGYGCVDAPLEEATVLLDVISLRRDGCCCANRIPKTYPAFVRRYICFVEETPLLRYHRESDGFSVVVGQSVNDENNLPWQHVVLSSPSYDGVLLFGGTTMATSLPTSAVVHHLPMLLPPCWKQTHGSVIPYGSSPLIVAFVDSVTEARLLKSLLSCCQNQARLYMFISGTSFLRPYHLDAVSSESQPEIDLWIDLTRRKTCPRYDVLLIQCLQRDIPVLCMSDCYYRVHIRHGIFIEEEQYCLGKVHPHAIQWAHIHDAACLYHILRQWHPIRHRRHRKERIELSSILRPAFPFLYKK
jgi:hypothetical protein